MTILTSDGAIDHTIDFGEPECCPPRLDQVLGCSLACSFVNLLPSGPLWDAAKERALEYYSTVDGACEIPSPPAGVQCQSMVAATVHLARVLSGTILETTLPAIRESAPSTAVTTLDDWLERFDWQDCYKTHCRSVLLGDLTPYEIQGICGPVFCPVDAPEDLTCAVKKGIIQALDRANVGGIQNLDWLNWVIEPLGAVLSAASNEPVADPGACCGPDGGFHFIICNRGSTLPKCDNSGDAVDAFIPLNSCNSPIGLPAMIWPGVIAAECLVRSLLPPTCPSHIKRCC